MTMLSVIAGLVLAGFLLFALCSNILFWYETLNSPENANPAPRPGILTCLQVYLLTLGGYFAGVFSHPIGWFWSCKVCPPAPGETLDRPPLILVHGINDNAAVWLFLSYILRKAGYRVSTFSYFSLFTSIDTIQQKFNDHVRQVEAAYAGRKPVFVCHSLGGVIVRRWLLEPENQKRTGGIVTLATPHGGSKLAALAPGALAKQITPASELIATLRNTPLQENVPCVALITPTDEAVLPSFNLLPPEGWKMRITHRVSHFGMLCCPRVAKVLLEELKGMPPAER